MTFAKAEKMKLHNYRKVNKSWNFSIFSCKTTVGDDSAAKWACVLVVMLYRYDETHNI